MAEASRRLKVRARKLGSCIDKARPFYEAFNMSKQSQQQCQIAAVKYQRANGKIFNRNNYRNIFSCKYNNYIIFKNAFNKFMFYIFLEH